MNKKIVLCVLIACMVSILMSNDGYPVCAGINPVSNLKSTKKRANDFIDFGGLIIV